jgi:hypothetical protein
MGEANAIERQAAFSILGPISLMTFPGLYIMRPAQREMAPLGMIKIYLSQNQEIFMTRRRISVIVCLALGTIWLLGGCGKDSDTPKYRHIEGKITAIDQETGEVTVLGYHPKTKSEIEITGTLANEAEILIDGKTAALEDLKVGDQVEVTGKAIKKNHERQYLAVRVRVNRAKQSTIDLTQTAPAEESQEEQGSATQAE